MKTACRIAFSASSSLSNYKDMQLQYGISALIALLQVGIAIWIRADSIAEDAPRIEAL